MNFDDVSVSLKTLFETATFSGYQDALVSAIMAKGYGLQPSAILNYSVATEACLFFFVWLVFGGFVVRVSLHPHLSIACGVTMTLMSAGSQSVHGRGRRHLPAAEG